MKALVSLASAILLPSALLSAEEAARPNFFPFVKGRYWLYDGRVAYAANGKVHKKEIKGWRSEVAEVTEGTNFQAALLKGHPGDLAWFEEGRKRSDIVVIVNAKGEYQEYRRKDAVLQFASIKANSKLPADMETELIFRYPPKEGERFSEENPGSKWATYCWVASALGEAVFDPPVKGLPESKSYPRFTVIYRTSPDHTIIGFAAGVGICAYTYVHHGTKGDCEVRLVETGVAKPAPDCQSAADAEAIDSKPQPPSTP